MNPFWTKVIVRTVLDPKSKRNKKESPYSKYDIAKGGYELKIIVRNIITDIFLIVVGIISAGFGLKGFLLANGFIDGGATGISLLINKLTGMPLSILLILVNLPFIILGYKAIGRQFAIKTVLSILGLALVVAFVPYPEVTSDKLLISVFGGFFLGMGIGLSVRGGAVIDGTEVLAIAISRRSGLSIGDIIMIVNIIIFSFAAYLLGVETALYAILTYLAASKTVDFILEGIEEYTGVTIVSSKADALREMISYQLNQGVTVYKGERGFGKTGDTIQNTKIIYTVVTRLEIRTLKNEVYKIDPNAFMVMNSVKDTVGGMTKKRRHKHEPV
ncbi:MAG TPA: YitT family protein [Saprospiraceae bacterium]|nr:YitT family protein [Saprospiraceae bacterium]